MMDINYELYKVFYFVARTLSFSEASKELYISQSAVSQSIKTLEKKLNQHLFIRSTKKVQLTPEGNMLFKHIEPAINLIMRGENHLMETHTLNGGQLRIGASDTICRYLLVPFLNEFHKKYPNVHIKVTNSTSIECVSLLENGSVDFIVTNFPNRRLQDNTKTIMLKEFYDVFIGGSKYLKLKDSLLTLAELQKYPLLMLDKNSTTSEYLHNLFQQYGLDLIPEIEISSNDLLIDLAKIGLGIAFIPDYCLPPESNELFTIKVKEDVPKRHIGLSYSDQIPLSQAAKAFIDLIKG
ncbi:DNA-binding transcriptional LysR family regulator [Natranaerovirga pectinivora]|uniref:DNA-binding transcriptional LysR family regulator n=2 Tax=Natranaerovirga pectinivora TaxID=682400 RepID=A0A4R3MPH0_9FIRM|nr:DNA-binding transcriptional LysR family regulator [Natranaerovirga pectinivora]